MNDRTNNASAFDPFAGAQPPVGGEAPDASNRAAAATPTPPPPQRQPPPKSLSEIQFRSSLQIKRDAKTRAEQRKEEEASLASAEAAGLLKTAAAAAPASGDAPPPPAPSSSTLRPESSSDDDGDPFAHLANAPPPNRTTSALSSRRSGGSNGNEGEREEEDDDDDDERIPIPDDPVSYQAREAALYAEELLNEEAARKRRRNEKGNRLLRLGLNDWWTKAPRGVFQPPPPRPNDGAEEEDETRGLGGRKKSAERRSQRISDAAPETPSVAVDRIPSYVRESLERQRRQQGGGGSRVLPSYIRAAPPPSSTTPQSQSAHSASGAEREFRVPDPDRSETEGGGSVADAFASGGGVDDESPIPWYVRERLERQQQSGENDDSRVPWFGRAPAPPSSTPLSQPSYSASAENYQIPKPVGGVASANGSGNKNVGSASAAVGASALGGVVGLVALGPLAGVAAAGGLAYAAATKEGAMGEVVRGAGRLVAKAVNAASTTTMKAGNDEKDTEPRPYEGPPAMYR